MKQKVHFAPSPLSKRGLEKATRNFDHPVYITTFPAHTITHHPFITLSFFSSQLEYPVQNALFYLQCFQA